MLPDCSDNWDTFLSSWAGRNVLLLGCNKKHSVLFSESGSESDGESSSTDTIYLFICLLFALKLQGYSCV